MRNESPVYLDNPSGIFPIMHAMVMRRSLAQKHAAVVRAFYDGFCAAKAAVQQHDVQGRIFNNMATLVPWLSKLVEQDLRDLGEDWWPSGMRANWKAVDTWFA